MKREYVKYQIAIGEHASSTLCEDGYSKYDERWRMSRKDELHPDEVYGLEQAKEHLQEVRTTHVDTDYEYYWANVKLTIQKVTTITETVAVDWPNGKDVAYGPVRKGNDYTGTVGNPYNEAYHK